MKGSITSITKTMAKQRGAVLIVALVLLLVLTILGTAGIQNTLITERMSGNYRDVAIAFESAEAGLRSGEILIADASTFGALAFDGSDGSWDITDDQQGVNPLEASTTFPINTDPSEIPENSGGASYYLERLPETKDPDSSLVVGFQDQPQPEHYYRVTSRGTGLTPAADVVLQSTYFR